ncbi:MAG: hypothetical protein EOP11_14870 [Proteobacteria bacterium]|nr:MAG: hypothetical protein EOP11_14870 [Pseudomonadota bacterium]
MTKFEIRKIFSLVFLSATLAIAPLHADAAPKKKRAGAKKTQNQKVLEDTEAGKKTGNDIDASEGAANLPGAATSVNEPGGAPIPDKISDEIRNNRLKTLDGSKSPISGQFNLGYSGASILNPFSAKVPNPGMEEPPPLAQLSGTVSARYRIDPRTSVGVGAGLTTYQPFQGPKDTSIADPYVDVARSYKLGPIQGRGSASVTFYSNNQYRNDYGYRWGFGVSNEAFYEFPFGLLTGLSLSATFNTFADGIFIGQEGQPKVSANIAPYLEFKLNDTLNLRSVTGFQFYHLNAYNNFRFLGVSAYQTVGLGIAATDAIFVYPYIRYFFNRLNTKDTTVGVSFIVNLF